MGLSRFGCRGSLTLCLGIPGAHAQWVPLPSSVHHGQVTVGQQCGFVCEECCRRSKVKSYIDGNWVPSRYPVS
jgi:hypothetical protein